MGLPSVEDVFSTCGRLLGRRLQRIPDGEPGGRRLIGIATECGMARARVPQIVKNLLKIHAAGSREPGA